MILHFVFLLVFLLVFLVLMFFFFRVIVFDGNFNYERFYVVLIRNFDELVDFIGNSYFFYHGHFNFLDHRILLNMKMVDRVNSLRLLVFDFFDFAAKLKLFIDTFSNLLPPLTVRLHRKMSFRRRDTTWKA